MTEFPRARLEKIAHIMVANEISDSLPDTHALMKQHGIAAIVPFYPHSRTAASWMLLGSSFSEQVHTPLDFRMVEKLFACMAEQFLDKLVFMRSQLNEARQQLRTLSQRLQTLEADVTMLRKENHTLHEQNLRLTNENVTAIQTTALGAAVPIATNVESTDQEKTLEKYVTEFEAHLIAQALKRCDGNKSKAARLLGLRPNTLHYKIESYGLSQKKEPNKSPR